MKNSIFLCTLLGYFALTYGDLVDEIGTCPLADNDCIRNQYNKAIKYLSIDGDTDLGIADLDELELQDISITSLNGQGKFKLITGTVSGIGDCEITKVDNRVSDKTKMFEALSVKCPSITLDARYKAEAKGLFGLLIGQKVVYGDGNVNIKLDNLNLNLYKSYRVDKSDGDYYIDCKHTNNTYGYDFEVKDKATFNADNVYFGKSDISGLVNANLNTNWKFYVKQYGRDFFDKVVEIIYKMCHTFFDDVPATEYLDDAPDYY